MHHWKLWLVYITVAVAFALPACAQDPTPAPCGPGTDHTCFEPGAGLAAVNHVSNWAFEDGIVVLFRYGIDIPESAYPIIPCRLDMGFVPSGVFSTDLGESFKITMYKLCEMPTLMPDITKAGEKIFGPTIYEFLLPTSPVEVVYAYIEDLSMGGYYDVPTINEGDFAIFIQYSSTAIYIPANAYIDWDFSTDALCPIIPHTNILFDQNATPQFKWLEDTPLTQANWIVELFYEANQPPVTPDVPSLSGAAILILVGLVSILLIATRR